MIYLIFIIGTLFGSFFLVVAERGLRDEDYISKSSYCCYCKKNLKPHHLIPVISYIFLKGKCEYCNTKLSIMYPLTEIITGLLFAYCFFVFGPSYEFFISLILSSLLIIICITDFLEYIILDAPLVVANIFIICLMIYFLNSTEFCFHFFSGIFLFSFFLLIKFVADKVYGRESMGGGDIKFAFTIGLVLGFELALYAIVLSAFLALPTSIITVMITKNKEVPYGPFLAGALLIIYLNMDKFITFFT